MTRSQDAAHTLTAAPAINVKPVVGGVEIAVRYITRANERYQMRAKLNQAAVDLLGQGFVAPPAAAAELRSKACLMSLKSRAIAGEASRRATNVPSGRSSLDPAACANFF